MKHVDSLGIIPTQYTGTVIEAHAVSELENVSEAKAFFQIAKSRLLRVNNWNQVAGVVSAVFQLVDATGQEVDRDVIQGDYFKINIPGPGSKEGDGYDWVLVETVKEINEEENQTTGFRIRPAANPFNQHPETAHFYSAEATGNFIIMRRKNEIIAWIVDNNLKPNGEANSLADKLRNAAVGRGAIGLFSKLQWQGLADGILKQ